MITSIKRDQKQICLRGRRTLRTKKARRILAATLQFPVRNAAPEKSGRTPNDTQNLTTKSSVITAETADADSQIPEMWKSQGAELKKPQEPERWH